LTPDPDQRWPESLFQTPTPLLFQNFGIRVQQFFKFENPTPVQTPATIINPALISSIQPNSGSVATSGAITATYYTDDPCRRNMVEGLRCCCLRTRLASAATILFVAVQMLPAPCYKQHAIHHGPRQIPQVWRKKFCKQL